MEITIQPGKLSGQLTAIPSKSQAHRLLICAAFAGSPTTLLCPDTNRDIEATVDCLNALGADIKRTSDGYFIRPIKTVPETAVLNCCESGSTLRFMLPIVGALGVDATLQMAGRLPQRPLSPMWEEMERMGCSLTRPTADTIRCRGKLRPGDYSIDGGVSSQYITGLLLAAPLMGGECRIQIIGKLESAPYVTMTQNAMAKFGVKTDGFVIPAHQDYHTPGHLVVEGDWSNGAFWLGAKYLGSPLTVKGLDPHSAQGDRLSDSLLRIITTSNGAPIISAADIPDLVPILSIVAGAKKGATFVNIQRLRIKESDRVASTIAMIEALGGKAESTEDSLTVYGTGYVGGTVNAQNDHRIAMSAAIAATVCTAPVIVIGAEAVKKSYPKFWDEYKRLGGKL